MIFVLTSQLVNFIVMTGGLNKAGADPEFGNGGGGGGGALLLKS